MSYRNNKSLVSVELEGRAGHIKGCPPVGECFGLHWLDGNHAHPYYHCYSDVDEVEIENRQLMRLGLSYNPRQIDGSTFPWAVGRVHSVETFKYGIFDVVFSLPLGAGLWPAVWLYDQETWPPEIDILEGWSGRQRWPLRRRGNYRRNLFLDYLFPSIHYGEASQDFCLSGGVARRGTWHCRHVSEGLIHAHLLWTPELVSVWYNGHRIMNMTEPSVLEWLNKGHPMTFVLNNYVQEDFTYDDFLDVRRRYLTIYDLTYRPL